MAEWLVEQGIGECRAVRLSGDTIVEARLDWPGELAAGWVVEARLIARAGGSGRGTALTSCGQEVLVTRLPRGASEGAPLALAITRPAIGEGAGAGTGPTRIKRAQGRPCDSPPARPPLAERLMAEGHTVRPVRAFPGSDWDTLVDEALAGEATFAGGSLLFAPTPAMLTVDVDGELPPRALALASVSPLAAALRRFDAGGSIVVDFPTLADKDDRRAVDAALDGALGDWRHERTAINGFGLVQLVRRLERVPLIHRAARQRGALAWRRLLRRAEGLQGPGALELAIAPRLEPLADAAHLAELQRRSGRAVQLRVAPGLAPDAPHAQLVPHE